MTTDVMKRYRDADMKELLLGCGNSRLKRFAPSAASGDKFQNLTTVDMDANCKPDILMNLSRQFWHPQIEDSAYDEVHDYEVLEHFGAQGDFIAFFQTFANIYNALKPGGYLCASCPSMKSRWAWGDPGHTRIISPESLTFLDQAEYTKQVGNTAMSDYRWVWKGDFKLTGHKDDGDSFMFILQAIKPSRITI